MAVIGTLIQIVGSLGLFLYGMTVLGNGIQQGAGSRLQKTLGFMTGSRISAVVTGMSVTAVIQSSSATTVMLVSFVNAGIVTLQQAIGVIMGANIGTTITAWIVSIVGFTLNISKLALPCIGVGFVLRHIKWKHQETGSILTGFGLLFLGLDFLTKSMPKITANDLAFISSLGDGSGMVLVSAAIGLLITVIVHSSSASTAIVLTMSFNGMVDYRQAAAMILGANIGTTIDAVLAAIGTKTTAKRTALVHVLFNVIGVLWALVLFDPFLRLVAALTPEVTISGGKLEGEITNYLAMFHTIFNVLNTLVFFPFVKPFARFVSFIIKDKAEEKEEGPYHFDIKMTSMREAPELYILRVEKEIRDMAGIIFNMYAEVRKALSIRDIDGANDVTRYLYNKTDYVSTMREQLTDFLMQISRRHINKRTLFKISHLLRILSDLKDMAADCYSMGMIIKTSVRKNRAFEKAEVDALTPYMSQVHEFLAFVCEHMGNKLAEDQTAFAAKLEDEIDVSRNALRKLGRKRIEEGGNVKTELLFIDMVRRIEKLGDYCYSISKSLARMSAVTIT
ncbi:MAG: Na/Pi cotransporter family protein [Spirochaetaceae bacterium]|jgi:phosphate:Na+ symporter|nr:Na/Pi cotransporter family protein [Spirochaetaceae bacterium]